MQTIDHRESYSVIYGSPNDFRPFPVSTDQRCEVLQHYQLNKSTRAENLQPNGFRLAARSNISAIFHTQNLTHSQHTTSPVSWNLLASQSAKGKEVSNTGGLNTVQPAPFVQNFLFFQDKISCRMFYQYNMVLGLCHHLCCLLTSFKGMDSCQKNNIKWQLQNIPGYSNHLEIIL